MNDVNILNKLTATKDRPAVFRWIVLLMVLFCAGVIIYSLMYFSGLH